MTRRMLQSPGWNERARVALERMIRKGAGQGLPAVFDFDNTIIAGDIGEATLAVLARSGRLKSAKVPRTLAPSFRVPGKPSVSLPACPDVTAYYEALMAATVHGERDPAPLANAYAWAVEVLEGLNAQEVVQATREAYEWGSIDRSRFIEVKPGRPRFPVPRFHPEMVELVRELLRHEFDVWIVSASNVWSVRWMVLKALNPLLTVGGVRAGLRADHVIGISTLLADADGGLHKDPLLVRECPAYAALRPKTLAGYKLTSRLLFPLPTYSGKIACILDALGRMPYFCAGDAPGDHTVMSFSSHRLWIARLEKPEYQRTARELIEQTRGTGWIIQAATVAGELGFVSSTQRLLDHTRPAPAGIRASLKLLSPWL